VSKAVLVDAVIGTRGAQWASQKSVVEDVIGRQRGVHAVDANPVTQTASVRFDPAVTSIVDLQRSMRNCGYDAGDVSGEAYVRRRFFVAAA
jgi:Cu2+-exporting ATPase